MLALGTISDAIGEMVWMQESTCLKTTVRFASTVVQVFGAEYLREWNVEDIEKLLAIVEARGFPSMSGSVDCMHWQWKNCPQRFAHGYQGHTKRSTIILKEVGSHGSWIWHAFFEMSGSHNDINVFQRSLVFRRLCNGELSPCNYTVNDRDYNMGYYPSDIYPPRAAFVKTIAGPQGNKQSHFAQCKKRIGRMWRRHSEYYSKLVEELFMKLQWCGNKILCDMWWHVVSFCTIAQTNVLTSLKNKSTSRNNKM
jgi:hypothetical protein